MENTDPSGSQLSISSDPEPYSGYGYESLFDMRIDKGFRFVTNENWRSFWLKVDFGFKKLVIGNNIYYCVTEQGRSYIFMYKMSYASGRSDNFTYWINPDSETELIPGIATIDEDYSVFLFEPQLVRIVKFEPWGYYRDVCFRLVILFCNGRSVSNKSCLPAGFFITKFAATSWVSRVQFVIIFPEMTFSPF